MFRPKVMEHDDEPANIHIFHQKNGCCGGAKQHGEEQNQQSDEDWSKSEEGTFTRFFHFHKGNKQMSQAKVLLNQHKIGIETNPSNKYKQKKMRTWYSPAKNHAAKTMYI